MAWKRRLGWLGIVTAAIVAVLSVVVLLVPRSKVFQRYVLTRIQKQASEATGAQVQIENFTFHLWGLAVDAYGITIRGSEDPSGPPLAQAGHLRIRLKIVSLLRKKIDLNEIVLHHPAVNIVVRKDGTTNLPTSPNANSRTNPFDLGIQHVLLEDGEVYYNDVKTPLNADLHDLRVEIRSVLSGKSYDGRISYQKGRVRYGDMKPVAHNLTASFSISPSEFTLKPLILTVASSTVQFEGSVRNYSQPSASGSYEITFHPQDARAVVQNADIPNGEVTLTGTVRYQQQPNKPALRALFLDGRLNARELAVNTADFRTVVRNIRAQFKLVNGNLDVRAVEADLLGGHLTATAAMQQLDADSTGKVHASIRGISLGDANAALRNAILNLMPIDGQLSGTADAFWTGGTKNIKAVSDIALKAAFTGASAGPESIPIDGEAHVAYDGRSGAATLTNTFVRTPQTRVDVSGAAGQKVDLNVHAQAADLRELDSVVATLQKTGTLAPGNTASSIPTNLAGTADLQALIEGSMNDPHVRGQLTGRDLQAGNEEWRALELRVQASKSRVSVENGSLVNARQGYIKFAFSSGLSNWHYLPSSPISLEISSEGLAIDPLLQLARLDYPISGTLSANVSLNGSQLNPQGNGSIRLARGKVFGERVEQLAVQFKGDGNVLTARLDVSLPAGSAKANLTFHPKTKDYEMEFETPGVNLARLQAVQQRNLGMQGVVTATARGRGTLDDPQLTASVQLPQLKIQEIEISNIKANLNVSSHRAEIALESAVAQSTVEAHGTVDLNGAHYMSAKLDTKGIPIEGLLALYGSEKTDGPRGVLELHASAEGPLNDESRLQAQVTIPTLKADYQGLQIANTRPIRVRYQNSIVTLDPAEISGTGADLRVQGQVPLKSSAAVTLSAVGAIDLQLLRLFQPGLESSGKLQFDLHGTGSTAHPAVQGQCRLQNVSLMHPDAPIGLTNVNGVFDVSNNQVNITQLTGESGGGQISAQGVIGYRPQLQANVALQAKKVRIRYQDQLRTVLDGNLDLAGTSQAATLSGRVLIDSLSFTPNFDLATFAGQLQSGPESSPSEGMANNIKLDITVQTSRDLNATSSAVSLQGQANLRVVGKAADPVIIGRTEFTAGDIFLMNHRYKIERGVIGFSNPNRTEPVLNVLLTTTISQYNLSLTFRGPLDKMQTNYTSDPPLPTADIINLIARGQTTQQAATSPSNFGATSLLAQGAASQVSSGVQKLAGLSSFSIDPTLGGNNTNPGARVAMQKRMTSNFLFTFSTDVTSAQREVIQGEYQLNKRWSASVTRDENGGFAVDGKYHKRY